MLPSFLCAFPELQRWLDLRESLNYADWVLDSGAFSVWNAGGTVDLHEYIAACKMVLAGQNPPTQVFALDVIKDWKASLANTRKMWAAGVEAMPTYHSGEPWEALMQIAREFPRIAIGGVANDNTSKMKFAQQCFARVWPKPIHGFSYCSRSFVEALPFASVDSTSWYLQPLRYHTYKGFDEHKRQIGKRNSGGASGCFLPGSVIASLRSEIDYYLELQRVALYRWRNEMTKIGVTGGPTLYLSPGNDMYNRKVATGFERD